MAQIGFSSTSSMHVAWTRRHPNLIGTSADPSERRRQLFEGQGCDLDAEVRFSHCFATIVLHRR